MSTAYRLRFAGIVMMAFLISAVLIIPATSAATVNCPALSLKDGPYNLTGQEFFSNTGKLSFGAKLIWKNPEMHTPARLEIWRKKSGEAFKKIGQVAAAKESYLDTTISKDVSAYIYAVKAVFVCGGELMSKPLVVDTSIRQSDTSLPTVTFIQEANIPYTLPKEGKLYFLLEDKESGINPDATTYKLGNSANTKFQTTGNNSTLLGWIPASAIQQQHKEVQITVTNGAGKKRITTFPLTQILRSDSLPVFQETPTLQEHNTSLSLSFNPENKGYYRVKISTDNGQNWPTVYEGSNDTVLSLSTLLPEEYAGHIFVKGEMSRNNQTTISEIIPLTLKTRSISLVNEVNIIIPPEESVRLKDPVSDKEVTSVVAKDGVFQTDIEAGMYVVDLSGRDKQMLLNINDSFQFTLFLPVIVKSLLSEEELSILSNTTEPVELQTIQEHVQSIQEQAEQESIPANSDDPSDSTITTFICKTTCVTQKFSSSSNSLRILWSPETQEFSSPYALQQREEKPRNNMDSTRVVTFTLANGLSFSLSKSVLAASIEKSQEALFEVHYIDGEYSITPSETLLTALEDTSMSFIGATMQNKCSESIPFTLRDESGAISRITTTCKDGVHSFLLPIQKGKVTIYYSPEQATLQLYTKEEWFAPYMNALLNGGVYPSITHASTPYTLLSREEFAYMLRKVLQLPLQDGQSNMEALAAKGIVRGREVSPGVFEMEEQEPINRAEVLTILLNTFSSIQDSNSGSTIFVDVSTDAWFYNAVMSGIAKGLIEGYTLPSGNTVFRPDQQISRAEASKLLYSALDLYVQTTLFQ